MPPEARSKLSTSSSSDSSDEEDTTEEKKQNNVAIKKQPISSHTRARDAITLKMKRLVKLLNAYKEHDYEGFLEATMKKP